MSEGQAAYKGDEEVLTPEQISQIVEAVRFVTETGFGKITVWIEKGHPVLIGVETTRKLVISNP